MTTFRANINSPIGKVEITASDQGINSVCFVESTELVKANAITDLAMQQLSEYFHTERTQFKLPLDTQGTEFQQSVWRALCGIDFGRTCSYQDIAIALKNPKAVRAVGTANGRNPISIIVPCHRVIGSNGTLTGYASGLERKAWLLKHEGALLF